MSNEIIPDFLYEKLKDKYGDTILKKITYGYSAKRKLTFRVNNINSSKEEIESYLKKNNIEYKKVSFYEDAFIVMNKKESDIELLDIYKDGKIYLQSLSSMIPVLLLDPKEKEDILDMAASPGGKTTQIASITRNEANLTACERNAIRAEKLKYNIDMQKAKVFTMIKDARQIDDFFSFDKILLDAPCSGSGIIDITNDKFKKYFTEELVKKSSRTQEALLNKAVKILKKGGTIIYSTCSILEEENEAIISKILKNNKDISIEKIDLEKLKSVPTLESKIDGVLTIMPNEEFEGFFVAKLKKNK